MSNKRTVYSTDPEPEEKSAAPSNPAGPLPTKQQNRPVIVGIERKGRGGKTVTIVQGVMSHPAGREALLKLLKNRLGTGGTIKDEILELQGDCRDQAVTILRELGYQAKKSGG